MAVACEGKTIVGSIMGVLCRDICKGCRPFLVIENVITKDGWRGKGVGRLLFETVEQWGKGSSLCLFHAGLRMQPHRGPCVL